MAAPRHPGAPGGRDCGRQGRRGHRTGGGRGL